MWRKFVPKRTVFAALGVFASILVPTLLNGQGCVAIRGFSSCTGTTGSQFSLMKGDLQFGANYRYFKSFRHFRGAHEEKHRIAEGTEVINRSSLLDLSISLGLSERIYASLTLPFVIHSRSSMYEHGGNPPGGLGERHSTRSHGLADLRIATGYWLRDPAQHFKSNYGLALGIKFPTGNFKFVDQFYNQGENRNEIRETVVDQSIQPGDGGTGFTLEGQSFHALSDHLLLSSNLYYLINPQATNGVLTRSGNEEFSCPDQFALRTGLNYYKSRYATYLGGRIEGVPATDIIGSSRGYRRPGYVISVEPGVSYALNQVIFSLNMPIALYRNRTQSFSDKQRTAETGVYRHGDAAFANYLVNFNVSYRFNVHPHDMDITFPESL
ncbi:MAG: transporter [Saprospiraceae bacterium]|nr:transporter [Saprospiraceae bacterium]